MPLWRSDKSYQRNTVVSFLGMNYRARAMVPSGLINPIANPTYWSNDLENLDSLIEDEFTGLVRARNLSDLPSPQTARENLGLGTVSYATITDSFLTDASKGELFNILVSTDFKLENPINPTDGQRITWRIKLTAPANITFGRKFRFNPNIPLESIVLSGYKNLIAGQYDADDDRWDIVAFEGGLPKTLTVALQEMNPSLLWLFNDSGPEITDYSGNEFSGNSTGVTFRQPSIAANEPNLKSITGGFVSSAAGAALHLTSFTIVALIKPIFNQSFMGVLTKAAAGGSEEWSVAFLGVASNILAVILNGNSVLVSNPPPEGVPVLLLITYDGATLKAYYDGVLKSTEVYNTTIPAGSAAIETRYRNDYNDSLDGSRGPHAIFNRVLSSDEIAALQATLAT